MDKNLFKYNKWNTWIKRQTNKKSAYSVFLYWLKVRLEHKSININFKHNPKQMKKSIELQYVDNKYDKVFKKLEKIYEGDFYGDDKAVSYIKIKIRSLSYNAKELFEMLNKLFLRKFIAKENMLLEVKNKINYINTFFKNTKEINLKKYCEANEIEYFNYESETSNFMMITPTKNQANKLASPSWCLLYDQSHLDHYFDNFKVYYIYAFNKQTQKMSLYGVNTNTLSGIELIIMSFDIYNSMVINQDIFDVLKESRDFSLKSVISKDNTNIHFSSRLIAVLNEIESDQWIFDFIIENKIGVPEMHKVIDTILTVGVDPVFLRLMSMLEDTNFFDSWVKEKLIYIDNKKKITDIEIKVVFNYILKYKSPQFIHDFLEKTYDNPDFNSCFNKLYKTAYSEVMLSPFALIHLKSISASDSKSVLSQENFKKKMSTQMIKACIKNIKQNNNLSLLFLLKKILGKDLLSHVDQNLYFKFSVKHREEILYASKLTEKSISFINSDHAIPKNAIIQYHLNNSYIKPKIFFKLESKTFQSNYQLFYKKCYKSHYHTLNYSDLPTANKEYSLYKMRNLFSYDLMHENGNNFPSYLLEEVLKTDDPINKFRNILLEVKDNKTYYTQFVKMLSHFFADHFSVFHAIVNNIINAKDFDIIDAWVKPNKKLEIDKIMEIATLDEIYTFLFSKSFLKYHANSHIILQMMNHLGLSDSPVTFFQCIEILDKIYQSRVVEGEFSQDKLKIIKNLNKEFRKKYGIFNYFKYVIMGVSISR